VRSNGKLAGWLTFVSVLSVLNYAGRFAGDGTSSDDVLYEWSTAILGVVQSVIVLALMLLIARGLSRRQAFALRRPRSWGVAAGLDLAVFFGILILAGILSSFLNPGEEQGLVPDEWDPSRAAPFVANAVVVIVLAPIVEELAFRGLGFTLLERFGEWSAILLVGVAFALAHGLVEGFPLLAVFGAGLAWIRARTHSLYPGLLLHAAFNAFALIGSVVV
jgi:uncharacterized protein